MEEKILEAVITSFIKEITNQSKDFLVSLGDEAKQILGRSLKKYLEKQKDKYSYIKTLLKGLTPVYLYDIYYPLKIKNENETLNTESVNNIFIKSNYLTLIGDAGSGKSTLIKHLFLSSIIEKLGIPILIELRDLNKSKESIETYVNKKIFENNLSQNEKILERLLDKGMFIFFLDGFDELNVEVKKDVVIDIKSFNNKFEKNKFILTTRPYSDIELLPLFHNYHIKKLSFEDGEIEGFIYKQLQGEKELADKIVHSIKNNKSEYLNSFLTNPLLLSLYILTFQSNAEIPNKKYIFYRRVINALFSEHDSKTKLGFVRDKLSNLNQEQFEEILKAFCFLSYFEAKFNWDFDYVNSKLKKIKGRMEKLVFDNHLFVKDLKTSVSLWVDDYGTLSFAHRSLQEYFAALFIRDLNPSDNKRIYGKIIERFSQITPITEIENFLSLCEEMDTLNFKQYYYLPVLKDLRVTIKNNTKRELVKSCLKFFVKGIFPQGRSYIGTDLNSEALHRGIYIHLPFIVALYRKLEILINKGVFLGCKSIEMQIPKHPNLIDSEESKPIKYISCQKAIPNDVLNACFDQMLKPAEKLDAYIDKCISDTEKFIDKSFENDKDLVDMI